jgi:hypothetical protein
MGFASIRRGNWIAAWVAVITGLMLCQGSLAGPFANLNFEDSPIPANTPVPVGPPQEISTSLLFPSWTLWIGENVQPTGSFNTFLLAGPQAALMASETPSEGVIEGTKSVYMSGWPGASTSLAQTGDVPAGTKSVRFVARNYAYQSMHVPPGPLFLRMNGQSLPLVILSSNGTGDFVFGADVTGFAGTTAELRFGVGSPISGSDTLFGNFDSVSFSPVPIPEPGYLTMFATCAMALLTRHRPI